MSFALVFQTLTGSPPFPWQEAMYLEFIEGRIRSAADLPTGLGKTSVVVIWLIALMTHPDRVPRRLVYVVNRRTVVDQTTDEVLRVRERLAAHPHLAAKLCTLCSVSEEVPLALSTLRGQLADNREWSVDPARPAVIVGTVDMIGSGLLFGRYACGFKTRPLHAAFLGQDALLVHDEAHLEPAFQTLLDTIVDEQKRCGDARPLKVLQLTATSRTAVEPFTLTSKDEVHPLVRQRLDAKKLLRLIPIEDEKPAALAAKLAELALARRESGRAVLVFSRSVEVVQKVAAALEAYAPVVLTGTMRGLERDELVKKEGFQRFLPSPQQMQEAAVNRNTCYLVATSAGEVGVNISADDLICDLSTYESMAQRLGRVNRFGTLADTCVEIVHPTSFKNTDPDDSKFDASEAARQRTLDLLQQLGGDGSPEGLRRLKKRAGEVAVLATFTPPPAMRPATDILFDAWAMTTIREPLPGRPPIAPYLHGEEEPQAAETYVAWRAEVEIISGGLEEVYRPDDLLEAFPLKPHELLRDRSFRIRSELEVLLKERLKACEDEAAQARVERTPVWILGQDGVVEPSTLASVADKENEESLCNKTLILPPSLGGLSEAGLLDGKAGVVEGRDLDVADQSGPGDKPLRLRKRSDSPQETPPQGMRTRVVIDTQLLAEDAINDEEHAFRYWLWFERPRESGTDSFRSGRSVSVEEHTAAVVGHARNIARKLDLSESLARCLVLAAKVHDLGKRRRYWQQSIGNFDSAIWLAKAGPALVPRPTNEPYRHEFGSLLDVMAPGRHQAADAGLLAEWAALTEEERDVVLHLVAAHHGRARPHFPSAPADETFDPDAGYESTQQVAAQVPLRFARLQRRFGRWGIAYLESLLRAADYAGSADIEPLSLEDHA